jgi:SNF2 family DNA or RNA helicase
MTKMVSCKHLPLDPKLIAFPYQQAAVEAIRDRVFSAVFHEQGLGKTKIAIDVALYWLKNETVDSVLIIAKKSLVQNWLREFKSHTHIKPVILTQSRKDNYYVFNGPSRIIVANYEVICSELERFKLFLKTREVGVILDESAKIKSPSSKITKIFHSLSLLFKRRIIMTGTPVSNRPYDIWSQIWFLDQGKSLGNDYSLFKSNVDLPKMPALEEKNQFETALEEIWTSINTFAIRETKNSGIISLPDKVFHTVTANWSTKQYDMYLSYKEDLKAIVIKEGIPAEDKAENILKRLLRLIQIASNPKLVDDSYTEEPGKLSELIYLIERIRRQNQKCIVWSCFTENIDWLAIELKQYGSCKVHGKMSIFDRNRSIDKFMSNQDTNILIATPGAAKEGLTLTAANSAIFYDRGFSLDDYLQAQDRIHRISQKQICHIYNILMQDSIDQWIDVLLHAKHMSAQLAQGDISRDTFQREMPYSFQEMLCNILGIKNQQTNF